MSPEHDLFAPFRSYRSLRKSWSVTRGATAGSSLSMSARKAARQLIASGDHIGGMIASASASPHCCPWETPQSLTTAFDMPLPRSREAIARLIPATCHSTERLCCEKGGATGQYQTATPLLGSCDDYLVVQTPRYFFGFSGRSSRQDSQRNDSSGQRTEASPSRSGWHCRRRRRRAGPVFPTASQSISATRSQYGDQVQ